MFERSSVGRYLCLGLLLGCTPAQTPPSEVAAPTVTAGGSGASDEGPLSEVPAPPGLFLLGRANEPEASIETLADWIHFPLPWREGLERELPTLASQLNATAPVDLAVALDPASTNVPEPLFAFSVGVNDLEGAVDALRASGRQVEKLGSGMHFVKLAEDLRCVVGRANGKVRARLVCGEERKALDVLAPYLTRTLPNQVLSDDDVFLEFRAEPLRQRFGKKAHMLKVGVPIFLREFALGHPRFDAAMADASHATVDELLTLIDELSVLRLRGNLDETLGATTVEFDVALAGNRSWLARTLGEQSTTATVAPELFWALPKDVNAAYYYPSTPTARYEPMLATLTELAYGAAEHFGAKTPALDAWIEAYRQAVLSPGVMVYATAPSSAEPKDPLSQLVGVHVIGVEGDEGRWRALVEQTLKVVNDAKLRKLAEQKVDEKLRHLPQVKSIKAGGLPKGASGYELRLTSKELEKLAPTESAELREVLGKEPVVLQLWVVSQAGRTWLALGDESARKRLDQVLAANSAETLASRPGLEPLRSEPANGAGFMTLASYADSMDLMSKSQPDAKVKASDVLLAMPAHGQTPILYKTQSLAAGPTLRISARAPKAALQDLTAAVISIAAQGGSF